MEFLKNHKQIHSHRTKKGKVILDAIKSGAELSVEYVSSKGKTSKRTIVPRGVYESKQGKLYLNAFCQKAKEERVFSFENLEILAGSSSEKTGVYETLKKQKNVDIPICSNHSCENEVEVTNFLDGSRTFDVYCRACKRLGREEILQEKKPETAKTFRHSNFKEPVEDRSMIIENFEQPHMVVSFDQLRTKLLEFSRRNNLINFNQSDRSRRLIRVVDEAPSVLLEKLIEKSMEFLPLPDIAEEPEDEKSEEFKVALAAAKVNDEEYLASIEGLGETIEDEQKLESALRDLKDKIRVHLGLPIIKRGNQINIRAHAMSHGFDPDYELKFQSEEDKHTDNYIQTLLMPEELERRLKSIYGNYRDVLNDKGLNIFYACFGFLKWHEHSNSDIPNFSPLLLLPIEITRKKSGRGYKTTFSANGSEPVINQTLFQKLNLDLGISLPEFGDREELDNTVEQSQQNRKSLEIYYKEVEEAVSGRDGWEFYNWVSFGFFNYQDIVIFNDLMPENWADPNQLFGHELVARLLGGMPANEVSDIGEARDIDELILSGEIPHLVMPADSSQHSAILNALEGKPLVIQGPPGTGKSQTITNLIAALVTNGKRVLFLAEKQPALNVVKDRLDAVGLGDLVFDPKVSGNKSDVYESLKRRKELNPNFSRFDAEKEAQRLQKLIKDSKNYQAMLEQKTAYLQKSLFEVIWLTEHALEVISELELPFYISTSINHIEEHELEDTFNLISRYLVMIKEIPSEAINLAGFSKLSANPLEVDLLQQDLRVCFKKVQYAQSTLLDCGFDKNTSTSAIIDALNLTQELRKRHNKEELSFVFGSPKAEQSIQLSLKGHENCQLLEKRFPFLAETKTQFHETLLSTARDIDNQINNNSACNNSTIQELQNIASSNDTYRESWVSLFQQLAQQNEQIGHLPFSILERVFADIWSENFSSFYESVSKFNTSRLTENIIPKLDEMILQISKTQSLLDGLPKAIDFDVIYNDLRLDELEALRSELSKIGLLNKYFTPAKKATATLTSIGIDTSKKDLALKWLDRLIECYSEAKNLDNNPEFALIFKQKISGAYLKQDEFILVADCLQKIFRNLKQPPISDLKNFGAREVIDLINAISNKIETFEYVQKVVGGISETLAVKDAEYKLHSMNAGLMEICSAAETLKIPATIELNKIHNGAGFAALFSDYFEAKASCEIPEIGDATYKDIELLLESFKDIASLKSNHELEDTKVLSNLILYEDKIASAKESLSEAEYVMQKFGLQFSHARYAQLSFSESSLSLQEELKFIETVSSADTSVLIKSAQSLTLEGEVSVSFDPEYFALLQTLIRDNGSVTEEEAHQFFVARVAKSILRNHFNEIADDVPVDLSETLGRAGDVFKKLDLKISGYAADLALMSGCNSPAPKGIDFGPVKNWTERSLINRELNKQRGLLPIRQLVKRATSALLGMKPIWFLNPVGVSQFLPRKSGLFDVVIIDEASQMLPEKAVAGIARGKNVVVVGDNKQMPPTNWMKASVDFGDDEEEEIDAESILDLAQQRVGNSVSLRWHYRSRHPNLIRFSNHNFYDDKLEIFPTPSPKNTSFGVKGIKVKGVYKGQVNQIELEEVMLQARDLMQRYPDESLGIVAINRPQMELIKQALETTSDTVMRDYIDKWDSDPLNALFVKNLDNVQGDERDNIIISTVYAPDEDGNLFQRFPSVASKNGHRRLNVLITRAKNRLILITSLNANDIKMTDNSPQGKQVFRDYIEYAMTGKLDTGIDLKKEADSDFEVSVGQILKKAGYNVTPQVGVRGFRIDLGVSHDEFPHGYIAGIECDGATFHSSASARDRDAIRQQILEGLGWKIYRIWSTDWFTNPAREREKLLNWLSRVWNKPANENEDKINEDLKSETAVKENSSEQSINENHGTEASDIGPSGKRGILNINGLEVEYWKPVAGLYELWSNNTLIGFTEEEEIEIADANSGFGKRFASQKVFYNTTVLKPKKAKARHDSFEIGLRWIYQQVNKLE